MRLLISLIFLCSCATYEQPKRVRTVTVDGTEYKIEEGSKLKITTTKYPQPMPFVQPLPTVNESKVSPLEDYDFTDIDQEIDKDYMEEENVELPELMPDDTVKYEGRLDFGKTVVKQ